MIFAHFRPREEKNSLKKYYSLDRTETNDFVIFSLAEVWGQVIFLLFPRLVDIYAEPLLTVFFHWMYKKNTAAIKILL